MLPIHQTALIFTNMFSLSPVSSFYIPCSIFSWLTPGFEPCSSRSQQDTLPDKLEPTFVFSTGLRFVRESNPLQQIDNL